MPSEYRVQDRSHTDACCLTQENLNIHKSSSPYVTKCNCTAHLCSFIAMSLSYTHVSCQVMHRYYVTINILSHVITSHIHIYTVKLCIMPHKHHVKLFNYATYAAVCNSKLHTRVIMYVKSFG